MMSNLEAARILADALCMALAGEKFWCKANEIRMVLGVDRRASNVLLALYQGDFDKDASANS